MNRNYQKELEAKIKEQQRQHWIPKLLLHSCCAPCSSYVLEYLSQHFRITVLYYNPNIYPPEEYFKRVEEQKNFIRRFTERVLEEKRMEDEAVHARECEEDEVFREFYPIDFVEGSFEPDRFYETVEGLEGVPEGRERCFRCYRLRLREAAEYAKRLGMDYFATTLSISPLKNAGKLNEIGEQLAAEYGVKYLPSDFKKKNGYKRSVELSKEYGMYRQDYCGCVFSMREKERRKMESGMDDEKRDI